MLLHPVSAGAVSGTGTVTVESAILGGVLITADGTNAAVVVLRRNNVSGDILFEFATKVSQMVVAVVTMEGTTTLYYDISGTGATAMLYEWIN